jgi:hypothetical protein
VTQKPITHSISKTKACLSSKYVELKLFCEFCGFQVNNNQKVNGFLCCDECYSANKRRELLLIAEKEWNNIP